jgi:TP901 family phage tail tape measure protein
MPESINVNINAKLGNATQLERQISNVSRRAGKNFKLDIGAKPGDISKLSQPLGRITGQADEFTKSIEASNARVIAFGASVGVINAVVKSFQTLVSVTINVEKQLSKINSILGANASQLNNLKSQIFDIAQNTGQTFDTVSEAALELSRQGLSATEVTKRLNDSLILARLSGLSASEAVSGLTAAVNSFSKAGLTTGEVLNKISNAANQFAVSERDLIEGFKRSASVAEQAGVSIDELGGIITAVQQRTARGGAVIGNSFKTIFTRIGRAENLELLKSIGVEITGLEGKILPATKLIENLSKRLGDLSDVEVRSVTEKIGGGFQIAPLLAALADYSSESSVAVKATEAFSNATDEAYKKNIILNQTLSAGINVTRLSIEELANALGELGIIDPFKELLAGVTGFVDGIRNVVQGINASDFFGPLFSGLSESLIKIGIAAFGAVLVVLSTRLAKFGIDSFKTFVGINKSAKELDAAQKNIISSLLKDKDLREQILKINNSTLSEEQKRLRSTKEFTDALKVQLDSLKQIERIAKSIAPGALNVARRSASSSSSSSGTARAAGGFLPIGQEQADVQRGVGGAPRNAKTVVLKDFNFGGGKKGTMVANDSEYMVPDYAGGGTAIFNQEMVRKMGLPDGAKKINASGGFVPNFAHTLGVNKDSIAIRSVTSPLDKNSNRTRGTGAVKNAIKDAIGKAKSKNFSKITADIISDSSLGAFKKYFGVAKRGKNTWDISQFKNAAKGFVPNFARDQRADDKNFTEWLKKTYPSAVTSSGAWSSAKALPLLKKEGINLVTSSEAQANRLYRSSPLRAKWDNFSDTKKNSYAIGGTQRRGLLNTSEQASKYGIIYPDALGNAQPKNVKVGSLKGVEYSAQTLPVSTAVPNGLYSEIRESLIDSAEKYVGELGFNAKLIDRKSFRKDVSSNINEGSVKAAFGTVFDGGISGALGSKQNSNATWDLPTKGSINKLFSGLRKLSPLKSLESSTSGLESADFKNTLSKDNFKSVLSKIGRSTGSIESEKPSSTKKTAAKGYVPNFVASSIKGASRSVGILAKQYPRIKQSKDSANKQFKLKNKNKSGNQLLIQNNDKVTSPDIQVSALGDAFAEDLKEKRRGEKITRDAAKRIEVKVAKEYGGSLTDEIAKYKGTSALDVVAPQLAVEVKSGSFDPAKVLEKFLRFPIENATNPREEVGGLFTDFSPGIDNVKYRKGTQVRLVTGDRRTVAKLDKENKAGNLKAKASSGYIPNYEMSSLDDAIKREKQAGVPVNQIRINQSGKLRNSGNPKGLAVTNTRDEPTGRIPNFAQDDSVLSLARKGRSLSKSGFGGGIEFKGVQTKLNKLGVSIDETSGKLSKLTDATEDQAKQSSETTKEGSNSTSRFLAVSTAAFTASTVLNEFAETSSGVVKNIAAFGSSLAQLALLNESIKQFGLDQKSLGKQEGEGVAEFAKRFGGEQETKAKARFDELGRRGKASKGIGKSLQLFGKFSGGLSKVVGLFGKLVPFIGPAITAFQSIAAIGKLFGFDVTKSLGNAFSKLAEKIGLIDSPTEKAAKSLGDFSKSLNDNLLQGKGGANIFAQTGIQAVTEARKSQLKESGIDVKGKTDAEIRSEAFEKVARESGGLNLVAPANQIDENATKEFGEIINANLTKQLLNFADEVTLTSTDLTNSSEVKNVLDDLRGGRFSSQIQQLENLSSQQFQAQSSGAGAEEIKKITQQRANISKSILKTIKDERDAVADIKKLRADVLSIQIDEAKKQSDILSSVKSRKEFELEIQQIALDGQKNKKIELDFELRRLQAQREGQKQIRTSIRDTILADRRVKQIIEGGAEGEIDATKFKTILGTIEQIGKLNIDAKTFSEEYAETLLKALTAITGQDKVAEDLVEKIKAQVESQGRVLDLQQQSKEFAEKQNLVLKDQADIRKEILRIQEETLRNENDITKSRFEAAKQSFDRGDRTIDRVFGGGEGPSVLDALNSTRERDKESIDIQKRSFERLEKVQSDFLSTARDAGISDVEGVIEKIRSLTAVDQSGAPTATSSSVDKIASELNSIVIKGREDRQQQLNQAQRELDLRTSNANTFKGAIDSLINYLSRAEQRAIENSPQAQANRKLFESQARTTAFDREKKLGEIRDKRKEIQEARKSVTKASSSFEVAGRVGALGVASEELKKLEKDFEALTKQTKIYSNALDGSITIEEARKRLATSKTSEDSQAIKKVAELSQRVAQSGVALEAFDAIIKRVSQGASRSEFRPILDSSDLRGGEVFSQRPRSNSELDGALNLLNDQEDNLVILNNLRAEEAELQKKLRSELEQTKGSISSFVAQAVGRTGSEVNQSGNSARSISGPASEITGSFSRLARASEDLRNDIENLESTIQDPETSQREKELAKKQKEQLEEAQKALEAQRQQNTESNNATEALKGFNSILDFIKKAFEKIKNFFTFGSNEPLRNEQPDFQESPGPFSTRTGEQLQRQGDLDQPSDVSFQQELDQNELRLYYQLEIDLINSTSTAQRRKLEREFEKRREILDLVSEVQKIQAKPNPTLQDLQKIQELRKREAEIKSRPDAVTDRIFDAISIDGPEAVENINSTLVKGAVDFREALVNGIEAAVVEGKDLKDTLIDSATSFLREITKTNLRNAFGGIASLISGGSNTFSGATSAPRTDIGDPLVAGQREQLAVLNQIAINTGGGALPTPGAPQFNPQGTANNSGGVGGSILSSVLSNVGSFFSFADGGKVTGGSGNKDDIPAMLMGGEYVMKKSSVAKYGPSFMGQINEGTLPKFANGGLVDPTKIPKQTGTGNYFVPGIRGAGKISGAEALRSFATQGFTTGETDVIGASSAGSSGGASFINLEPESLRLTNFGRKANTPLQQATKTAKQEAFNLAIQDDELRARIDLENKKRKEEFKKAIINMVISTVVSAAAGAAANGLANGAGPVADGTAASIPNPSQTAPLKALPPNASAGQGQGFWGGVKSFFTGAQIPGGGTEKYGGLFNTFNSRGSVNASNLNSYFLKNPSSPAAVDFFNSGDVVNKNGNYSFNPYNQEAKSFASGTGRTLSSSVSQAYQNSSSLPQNQNLEYLREQNQATSGFFGMIFDTGNKFVDSFLNRGLNESILPNKGAVRYATGGSVRGAAGTDTVSAMLSAGEFVVNSSAASRIGQPALERLNSGVVEEGSEKQNNREVVDKLDELIKTTKSSTGDITITVNGDGTSTEESGNSSQEEEEGSNMKMAKLIKQEVLKVINEEKRLGGTLRRGV